MKTDVKTIVIEAKPCPNCGRLMPGGALAGLCPACLLAQGAGLDPANALQSPRFDPPAVADIAKLFPQLEILALLGAGGMGAVYKARQPALDRLVALKILPTSGAEGANFEERFNREARALARLSHPNIVAVHEFGKAGDLHFFIMEFVDGANLRQLEQAGRRAPREALQIIPQICDALQYAHDEGVVHRDIKPENVLVDRKGRVKIADFGLAKIVGQDPDSLRLTAEGQVMGTPHYMAPEQIERPLAVDHRADIYALGVVFYEMLTGDLPLGKFPPPSRKVQIDLRLDDVVLRALENDPERRYQKASEVKSQVETIVQTPVSDAESTESAPAQRSVRWAGFPLVIEDSGGRKVNRKEVLLAAAVIFGLLTLAFGFVSAITGRSLLGVIGVIGWQSVVARIFLAAFIIAIATRWAWRQPITTVPSNRPWWRRRRSLLGAVFLLFVTWTIFQEGWLLPRLREGFAPSGIKISQIAKRDAQSGRLAAKLPGRGTVELLAVGETNAALNGWWNSDGTPLGDAGYETPNAVENSMSGRVSKDVIFHVRNLPAGASSAGLYADPPSGAGSGGAVLRNGKPLFGALQARFAWKPEVRKADLQMGFALKPWRTIATISASGHNQNQTRLPGDPFWRVNFHHAPADTSEGAQVALVFGPESRMWSHRVVAIDTNGVEHSANHAQGTPLEKLTLWTYTFNRVPLKQAREFHVQVRPVHWVEFPDVALVPRTPLPPPHRAQLGPVHEIAFNELIDFDAGVVTNFPPDRGGARPFDHYPNLAWMREKGFDAGAWIGELRPVDVDFTVLENSDWESLTAPELMDRLHRSFFRPGQLKAVAEGRLPATYGFRTREHGVGILQLREFVEGKPGATIRYKLVQRESSK